MSEDISISIEEGAPAGAVTIRRNVASCFSLVSR